MLRFDTPPAHVRSVALLEGLSYVLLLFVAMPLKYFWDQPLAVRVLGSAHGALFVWLFWLLYRGWVMRDKSFGWAARIGISSLIPFGTFAIDRSLAREDEDYRRAAETASSQP